jgi:hypothetical protein
MDPHIIKIFNQNGSALIILSSDSLACVLEFINSKKSKCDFVNFWIACKSNTNVAQIIHKALLSINISSSVEKKRGSALSEYLTKVDLCGYISEIGSTCDKNLGMHDAQSKMKSLFSYITELIQKQKHHPRVTYIQLSKLDISTDNVADLFPEQDFYQISDQLMDLIKKFPNLTKIRSFTNLVTLSNIKELPQIIDFYDWTTKEINKINFQSNNNLLFLTTRLCDNLNFFRKIVFLRIPNFGEKCDNLDLSGLVFLEHFESDAMIGNIEFNCESKLKSMKISFGVKFSLGKNVTTTNISQYCLPNISKIEINHPFEKHKVDSRSTDFFSWMPNLHRCKLYSLHDDIISSLLVCKNLDFLELMSCKIRNEKSWELLLQLKNLRALKLNYIEVREQSKLPMSVLCSGLTKLIWGCVKCVKYIDEDIQNRNNIEDVLQRESQSKRFAPMSMSNINFFNRLEYLDVHMASSDWIDLIPYLVKISVICLSYYREDVRKFLKQFDLSRKKYVIELMQNDNCNKLQTNEICTGNILFGIRLCKNFTFSRYSQMQKNTFREMDKLYLHHNTALDKMFSHPETCCDCEYDCHKPLRSEYKLNFTIKIKS